MVFCMFSDAPPSEAKGKGSKGASQAKMIELKDNPNTFETNLCNAPSKNCPCCILGSCCAPCGFSACYTRDAALKAFGNGVEDYMCCQGYAPKCCCFTPGNMGDKGSCPCMICEGCCFPVLSISFTRIYVMEQINARPDPVDYQLIAFSNCMQMLSCICNILACVTQNDAIKQLADIIECIADIVTFSVAGCMVVQIEEEIKKKNNGLAEPINGGAPVEAIEDAKTMDREEEEEEEATPVVQEMTK